VVGTVAAGAVGVAVAVVARQQALQCGHQVALRAAARLHQGHAGGGVGHEDAEQPVTARLVAEALDLLGDVEHACARGVDLQVAADHGVAVAAGDAPGEPEADGVAGAGKAIEL
jgi:hypothetical protein